MCSDCKLHRMLLDQLAVFAKSLCKGAQLREHDEWISAWQNPEHLRLESGPH